MVWYSDVVVSFKCGSTVVLCKMASETMAVVLLDLVAEIDDVSPKRHA